MFLRLNKFNQHSPKSQPHENQVSILKNHNYIQLTDKYYVSISLTRIFIFLYNSIHVYYQYSRFTLFYYFLFCFSIINKGWNCWLGFFWKRKTRDLFLLFLLLLLIHKYPRFPVLPFNDVYVWFFKKNLGGFYFWNVGHFLPKTLTRTLTRTLPPKT